jgi:hypothetical protein
MPLVLVQCQTTIGWPTINNQWFHRGVTVSSPPLHATWPSIGSVCQTKSTPTNQYPSSRTHCKWLSCEERCKKVVYLDVHLLCFYHFITLGTPVITASIAQRMTVIVMRISTINQQSTSKKYNTIHPLFVVMFDVNEGSKNVVSLSSTSWFVEEAR